MTEKIAIVIRNADFLFADNVGATFGGAAVVAKNVYETLKNDFGLDVHIYTRMITNGIVPEIVFMITESTSDFVNKLQAMDYCKIFTFSMDGVYINQFLQVMSKYHSIRNSKFFIRPILKILNRKKLEYQSMIYSNRPEYASFIAMSQKVKFDYVKSFGIPEDKIRVVYPCCNVSDQDVDFCKSSEDVRLGIVANSSINKGGHYFLFMAGLAKLFGAKFKIVMIATKYKNDILMRFLVNLFNMRSIIKVVPRQIDMNDFYKDVDCIVLPSQNEAFGLVALEAMSKGKVPIVSDTAGVSEIISDNCGVVFSRNSMLSLIYSIINVSRIYRSEYEKFENLSKSAYEISKKYSWYNFCKEILENPIV